MTETPNQPIAPKSRRWTSLLLVLIAIVVALALAEGLIRLASAVGWVDLNPTLSDIAVPDEIADQVDHGPQAVQGPLYIGDPVLHHRMAPNWSGAFPPEIVERVGRTDVSIETNSLGLRSPELMQPKPADVFRIVVLGDSVTFGWGVHAEDTYASQLAGLLAALHPGQRFEVVNAGVSGYGTWQEALWLQQQVATLQPDLVIVQAHLNDAADNLWGTYGQAIGSQNSPLAGSALLKLIQLVLLAQRGGGTGSGSCANDWNEAGRRVCWDTTMALLDEIQSTASQADAKTVLMPMPMRWQVEPGVTDPRTWVDAARYQDELGKFASRHGWLFVDPLPAFQSAAKSASASLFLDVGHPSEAGHRILAQELYRNLNQAGLLP